MDINNQRIDWNSPDVLMQIANNIESPLTSIIEANNQRLQQLKSKSSKGKSKVSEIIFSNSQEIASLIKEVVKFAKSKSVSVSDKSQPSIFQIYSTNPTVQSLCKKEIVPEKISKTEQSWLLDFEKEVFKQIKNSQLNLYDLSYNLAISERQLHRKIKNLLHLTPNKYIRILKLQKAKELLDDYMYDTISEVSYAVGYYDTHYFSKLFYKQYGSMPKELLSLKR